MGCQTAVPVVAAAADTRCSLTHFTRMHTRNHGSSKVAMKEKISPEIATCGSYNFKFSHRTWHQTSPKNWQEYRRKPSPKNNQQQAELMLPVLVFLE